jgi:hypothetical protein
MYDGHPGEVEVLTWEDRRLGTGKLVLLATTAKE